MKVAIRFRYAGGGVNDEHKEFETEKFEVYGDSIQMGEEHRHVTSGGVSMTFLDGGKIHLRGTEMEVGAGTEIAINTDRRVGHRPLQWHRVGYIGSDGRPALVRTTNVREASDKGKLIVEPMDGGKDIIILTGQIYHQQLIVRGDNEHLDESDDPLAYTKHDPNNGKETDNR